MKSRAITTVAQLDARLHEQILEVATLRLALDIQGARIAHLDPERDRRLDANNRSSLRSLVMHAPHYRHCGIEN